MPPVLMFWKPFTFKLSLYFLQVLHEDIVAHQQPVVEVVQTAQQLIDQFADRLKPTDRTKLEDLSSELKKRYDVVYVQSQTRENRLNGAIPELDKILEDNQEITQWLGDADRQLQVAEKDIGKDLKTLKDQFENQSTFNEEILTEGADVRFLNMNAKRNMDAEKVKTNLLVHIGNLQKKECLIPLFSHGNFSSWSWGIFSRQQINTLHFAHW